LLFSTLKIAQQPQKPTKKKLELELKFKHGPNLKFRFFWVFLEWLNLGPCLDLSSKKQLKIVELEFSLKFKFELQVELKLGLLVKF
jgi:hypothetical protein